MRKACSIASHLGVAVIVIGGLFTTGCTPAGRSMSTVDHGSSPPAEDLSAAPVDQAGAFCQALVHAGLVNAATIEDSKDAATMLPALDALVTSAPDDIASDFAIFDQVEHATLDPASDAQHASVNNPGTQEALRHFAIYLHDICRLNS